MKQSQPANIPAAKISAPSQAASSPPAPQETTNHLQQALASAPSPQEGQSLPPPAINTERLGLKAETIKPSCAPVPPSIALPISSYLPAVIPAVIAAVGWAVAAHHATERERRKEARSRLEQLSREIDSLVSASREYLLEPSQSVPSAQKALEIKLAFQRLDYIIQLLAKSLADKEIVTKYEQFFDSITGETFDSVIRQPLTCMDPLLFDQVAVAGALTMQMESAFSNRFDSKMGFRNRWFKRKAS
ncbi:hypothetical protein [Uliginosibacterium sp. 31-12]|uniref:hypothetical protein n=1 Tax=Uliginosibacterium sp. 31-12 TaxID=3062781 RepID=UPI0026E1D92D|nr:hypothetical protein [Uliginosibacterium sp. 31-12]MDO6384690.1 hypothetical protein [Uliginosibacterium sp. 31-12]